MFAPKAPHTFTPPPGGKPRVLVVDDEPVVRGVAKLMLEMTGYAVEEAADASQAFALVRSAAVPFAAVLLDYTLPDRTGLEILTELRHLAPESRIVLTSGRSVEDFPEHGADAYLPKPFTKDQLLTAVRSTRAPAPK